MPRSTALITGASRGIGAAIAHGLARDGIRLIGIHYGRDRAAAEGTATRIRAEGATPVLIQADLARSAAAAAQVAAQWKEAVTLHGYMGTDVLVSNAGINGAQPIGQLDTATYDRVLAVNLAAPTFLLHHLTDHLNDNGRVVAISTGYTRIAAPTHIAYTASKAGLEGVIRAVAPELAKRGITANSVAPGVVDTDINADWIDAPGAREHAESLSAFGRLGTSEDIADVVRYLAGDGGRWITGQTIDATGGTRL